MDITPITNTPSQDVWDLFNRGDYPAVVEAANRGLDSVDAGRLLHFSGLSLVRSGQVEAGAHRLAAAIHLYPDKPRFYINAAVAMGEARELEWAVQVAEQGHARFPEELDLLRLLGNLNTALGRTEAAESAYRGYLRLQDDIDITNDLASAVSLLGRPTEAAALYRSILARIPDHEPATLNLVQQLVELGEDAEVDAMIPKVRAAEHPTAPALLASLLLARGELREGFALSRGRWELPSLLPDKARMQGLPIPHTLVDLAGQPVLVVCEQGFGDMLQFIRYVPMLLAHTADVTVEAPAALVELFGTLHPNVKIEPFGCDRSRYTRLVPLLDLPILFETTLETIPNRLPYLSAPPDRVAAVKLPRTPGWMRVGLLWSGARRASPELAAIDRRRSMSFQTMAPLLTVSGVAFLSLQMPDCGDPPVASGRAPLQTVFDGSESFAQSAAIYEQLDLVIAVDTSGAHLAGALGKPVWLLSRRDACWRWHGRRADSPWYPVMRLYHQPSPGAWGPVIDRVRQDLAEVAEHF